MPERYAVVRHRTRAATAASAFILVIIVFVEAVDERQVVCSKTCVAENCNTIGIRYGKYCGVGWTGCPGEKPCDDLDACCKIHDECVERKGAENIHFGTPYDLDVINSRPTVRGLTNIKCHEKFKRCIKKVHKNGNAGFSKTCPYDTAVPTMVQGMDMAILFSQFDNSKKEL